ncbi:MAG: hypothetical protein KAI17_22430, partial [Thiotrichaceae bacterium]|nr:hypothetical protein [Thiotrichaceae bacterium]
MKVALYGMDSRTYKTMVMYLQGPCKGIAIVVDESEAAVDIIDADCINARDVLEERQSKTPCRPIILLSLQPLSIDGAVYVKKPVQTADLIAALEQISSGKLKKKSDNGADLSIDVKVQEGVSKSEVKSTEPVVQKKQAGEKHVDTKEKKKIS